MKSGGAGRFFDYRNGPSFFMIIKNKGKSANLIAFSYQEKEGLFILHREMYILKGFH
ncbi:hypothetical protein B425_1938 [Bacillus amyloliquefaciens]|nr:hypothetical protein B425_1938 [Bacillus amyloliquefaciens]